MISVRYKPKSVTNRTGIVMIIPVLVCYEIFTPYNVAKIGILGPKSEPMTFA